ncbi:hypothetical protein K458DRAFT_411732 [Lentithecium fluviatile CBS 122367]|uniref:Uncharacterized protein n=1 Tax=Lentithecium fluviatile CBS 122367 TaxID=1168545 RepID=A0A6G1JPG7_9PLEO|nr:hypothetical protein K458DRAFT_411732 [Lentithecium fluviatile CBS 122367]
MEKAETQRVIQLSEDIDRQDQHEAKHKSELAAKEQRHKIKLAVQEQRHKKNVASSKLLWEGKLKQMETKLKTHYNEREKQHETKIAQMNNALKKQEENFDKECRKVREMKEQYETKFAKLQTLKEQLAPEHAKALQTPPCRKRKLDGSEMCGIERGPSSKKSRVGGGM